MTSDGIKKKDWDKVKNIALKIANVSCLKDDATTALFRENLLARLDILEQQYGELPSIVATRAEYVIMTNQTKGLKLFKHAYRLAKKLDDKVNMTFISSSLAEIYFDDIGNIRNGSYWLNILKACLKEYFDEYEFKIYKRLNRKFGKVTRVL